MQFGDLQVLQHGGSDARSVAGGGGASLLGHVSGIRNLDPPDPQQAVKYGDGWGRKTGLSPLKAHTKEECGGREEEEAFQCSDGDTEPGGGGLGSDTPRVVTS